MLVYGPRACPFLLGSPGPSSLQTTLLGRLGVGAGAAGGCSDPGNGLEQYLLPLAKGATHLPSQTQARNSLQDARLEAAPKLSEG